jgi:hypothetical protein
MMDNRLDITDTTRAIIKIDTDKSNKLGGNRRDEEEDEEDSDGEQNQGKIDEKNKKKKQTLTVWLKDTVTPAVVSFLFPPKDPTMNLIARFSDQSGKLERAMEILKLTHNEKRLCCNLWLEIDSDMNNKMSLTEFCDYFSIECDEWIKRMFLIMNPRYLKYSFNLFT